MNASSAPQHPNLKDLWFHRRAIAYASLGGLFATLAMILTDSVKPDVVPLAQTLCWVFGCNIIAYVANSAFESFAAMKFGK